MIEERDLIKSFIGALGAFDDAMEHTSIVSEKKRIAEYQNVTAMVLGGILTCLGIMNKEEFREIIQTLNSGH